VTAMAEALFKEGKKLLAERQIPEACRKFESSYRMMRPSGTVSSVPELDRSHPAVTTLAALADVDPRTGSGFGMAWR